MGNEDPRDNAIVLIADVDLHKETDDAVPVDGVPDDSIIVLNIEVFEYDNIWVSNVDSKEVVDPPTVSPAYPDAAEDSLPEDADVPLPPSQVAE